MDNNEIIGKSINKNTFNIDSILKNGIKLEDAEPCSSGSSNSLSLCSLSSNTSPSLLLDNNQANLNFNYEENNLNNQSLIESITENENKEMNDFKKNDSDGTIDNNSFNLNLYAFAL